MACAKRRDTSSRCAVASGLMLALVLASSCTTAPSPSDPRAAPLDLQAGIERVADELAAGLDAVIPASERPRVAVLALFSATARRGNFAGDTPNDFGRFVADELLTRLVRARVARMQFVEREYVNQIMDDVARFDANDVQVTSRLMKSLDATYLVTGRYTPLDGQVWLNVRAVDLRSAAPTAASTVAVRATRELQAMIQGDRGPGMSSSGERGAASSQLSSSSPSDDRSPGGSTVHEPEAVSSAAAEALAVSDARKKHERFAAVGNGTVIDTETNLMWAERDNAADINWSNAKIYAERSANGGYDDWRLPTQNELFGLYQAGQTSGESYTPACNSKVAVKTPRSIRLTCSCHWASETRGSEGARLCFPWGMRVFNPLFVTDDTRVLPVRSYR